MKRSEQVKEVADQIAAKAKIVIGDRAPQDYWKHEKVLSEIAEVLVLKLLADLQ